MAINISLFRFGESTAQIDPLTDFVARLRSSICNRNELFDTMRDKLRLPDYFGDNWDALSECLRDLSWIVQHRVVIVHEELPMLEGSELRTYLEVLSECVEDWKPGELHEVVVTFPASARDAIMNMLGGVG